MKRILAVVLVISMAMVLLPSCGIGGNMTSIKSEKKGPLVVLVCGGLADSEDDFLKLAWDGCVKARQELGVRVSKIFISDLSNAKDSIEKAIDMKADLIVCSGYEFEDAVREEIKRNPDTFFLLSDFTVDSPNISSITYDSKALSFLAGVAAAAESKTGVVGFIGGEEDEVIFEFASGFEQGAKYQNPNIQVEAEYTGSYRNQKKGAEILTELHKRGCDVVFTAAGGSGLGAIKQAQAEKISVIGVDTDQSDVAPDAVLCSAVKRTDLAIFYEISKFVAGDFEPGLKVYGLLEGTLDISDNAGNLSEEAHKAVDDAKYGITCGEIKLE